MQILPAIFLLSSASALAATFQGQRISMAALPVLHGRQVQLCKPVPAPGSCEASCGLGYITCVSFPTCYNPTAGEICCSNGKYCKAGTYCTNKGCCPDGTPLEKCGATVSLSIILPGKPTTSTSTSTSTSVSTAKSSYAVTTQSSVTVPKPTASSNVSVTAPSPPKFTGGAAEARSFVLQFCIMGTLVAGLLVL